MATWQLPPDLGLWLVQMAYALHGRLAFRLAILMTGLLFGRGRRTVASWLRAAGIGKGFKNYYYFLGSLGRNIKFVGGILLGKLRRAPILGGRVLLARGESPKKRFCKWGGGGGVAHNTNPRPAHNKFLLSDC